MQGQATEHELKAAAFARAERRAALTNEAQDVYEHVGLYGRPEGDITARHVFMVVPSGEQMGDEWALVAIAEPGQPLRLADPMPPAARTRQPLLEAARIVEAVIGQLDDAKDTCKGCGTFAYKNWQDHKDIERLQGMVATLKGIANPAR